VTTAIGAVVPRHRTTVAGEVMSVTSYRQPWVRTDIELNDGTGVLMLRFLGRSGLPGLETGRRITASGTPSWTRGVLVMLNPRYAFVADG
jgi:RecG-like helicase